MTFIRHIRNFDWLLLAAVFILCAISLLSLYSMSLGEEGARYFLKQLIFVLASFTAMVILSYADIYLLKNYSSALLILYILAVAALVAVFFAGHRIRGAVGWFKFGELSFEPVEAVKLIMILFLAKYFSQRHVEVYRARHIIVSALYIVLPVGLVLLQPDLGSASILAIIWLGIVLMSGIKLRHLAAVLMIGILIFSLAWFFGLKNYQKERILTFLNPAHDPQGSSYNLIQSKIAVGSGGLWGKGLGYGSQGRLNFLPEKQTDFIFANLAEEWGFAGVLFLLGAYALFFWRLIRISLRAANNFFRLFTAGFALMIFGQVFINIGMNLGVLPVTGIALPFVSYGGSNLLINFLALGIAQNIFARSAVSQNTGLSGGRFQWD